jgi:hypothetical protein
MLHSFFARCLNRLPMLELDAINAGYGGFRALAGVCSTFVPARRWRWSVPTARTGPSTKPISASEGTPLFEADARSTDQ